MAFPKDALPDAAEVVVTRVVASAARAVRPAWGTSRPGRSAPPRGSARPVAARGAAAIRPARNPGTKGKTLLLCLNG